MMEKNVSLGPEHWRMGKTARSCDEPMEHGVGTFESLKKPNGYSIRIPPPLGRVPLADNLKDTISVMFTDPAKIEVNGRILKVNGVTFPVRDDSHKKITAFESEGTTTFGTKDAPSEGSPLSCPLTFLPQQLMMLSVLTEHV
jgi:hypothetical protein